MFGGIFNSIGSAASAPTQGGFNWADLIAPVISSGASSIGGYLQNQATVDQQNQAREDNQAFQTTQDQQDFAQQLQLEHLRASLDKGAGAAVAAAKIRAQSEREANQRQAYEALMSAILRGGDLQRQSLGDFGQTVASLRLPGGGR